MCLKVCVHLQKACVALTWLTLVENSVQTVVELVDVPISPPENLIACCILVSPRPVKKDTSDRNSAFPTAYLKGSPSFDQNPDGELAFGTICHWYPGMPEVRSKPSTASPTSNRSPRFPVKHAYLINIGGHSSPNWGSTLPQVTEWRWSNIFYRGESTEIPME